MQFQFDANQPFQLQAIESIADLFRGQTKVEIDFDSFELSQMYSPVANRIDLEDSKILSNLQTVQKRFGIEPDNELNKIKETIGTIAGETQVCFPNFSVEMETGTGKTYVYLRTALELNRRYGLRKFIVVVPSVAVREGVLKSLKMTQSHLRSLYNNVPYRFTVYDSKSIAKVRQFAQSDCVEMLVMTIDSFNKDENVIRQQTDRLQGSTPIHLIQAARPVLILDEPQNMESEARIQALASLDPLFALRYSATHRNPYNLVYRLTPFEAYRQGLVKRIEVASVVKEDDYNSVFLRLDEIRTSRTKVQAKIAVHKLMANGTIKEKTFLFNPDQCLMDKAKRPEYKTFVIDEIDASDGFVRFQNGIEIKLHESQGADQAALFREQIRYTIEEHFRKQKKLRASGIKVLSLFFIDRVDNFVGQEQNASATKGADTVDGLYPGILRELFDEAFNEIKPKYEAFADKSPEKVRAAYFAQKKRRDRIESVDTKSGASKEDRVAFNLIMREKETLLSFKEDVSFIFSHSALREGWDNPNVCQICTLNQTVSEIKKRQEVGRGMRLLVNQQGVRVSDEKLNTLTVIANESYEQFVASLQQEMEADFGAEGAAPKPVNARVKHAALRKSLTQLPKEFADLWEKIKHKTRYQVTIDTENLVKSVIASLDNYEINLPQIMLKRAEVKSVSGADKIEAHYGGEIAVATLIGRGTIPNLVSMLEDLIAHITPPIRLTRRTLARIVTQTKNSQAAIDNPQEFASIASRVIREQAIRQLVDGIEYEKDGTWYEMSQWVEEEETTSDRLIAVTNSIYDHIVFDSNVERAFAQKLSKRNDVKLFVKLPAWFKISTPVGQYNPDWALVMQQLDQFGDAGRMLYLIRETKGTTEKDKLRGTENQKIHCGRQHFNDALKVDYKVITSADDLP